MAKVTHTIIYNNYIMNTKGCYIHMYTDVMYRVTTGRDKEGLNGGWELG